VDDNRRFLEAARTLLEREGVDVVGLATTADGALEQVATLRPEVVLVDIDLGGESGFDLTRALEGIEESNVILISTHSETDYADLIAGSPALGFISKSEISATAVRELVS
jgi:two-component system, NarL family, nitrate/nitrite response regulator NarL